MKTSFACATCGSSVGYDLVAIETNELRQYGVHHYVCTQPCPTCEAHEPADAYAAAATV